jgi:glycerol-3-phosphate O-acyltransferase
MRDYCALRGLDFQKLAGDARKLAIGELGKHLMARVGSIVPVVPVPLIAWVLLNRNLEPISELELKSAVEMLIEKIESAGGHVYIPRKDLDYAVTVGLRMLLLRRLVEEKDGLYAGRAPELPLLRYYANSIAHLLR